MIRRFYFLAILTCLYTPAYAACISPVGDHGDMLYNRDHTVMQYCNGTNWISMDASRAGGGGDNLGNHTATQDLDLANFKATNAAIPTASADLTNKAYVDAAVASAAGSNGGNSGGSGGGSVFNVWGSADCPGGSSLLYSGEAQFGAIVNYYNANGLPSVSNTVCMQNALTPNTTGGNILGYTMAGFFGSNSTNPSGNYGLVGINRTAGSDGFIAKTLCATCLVSAQATGGSTDANGIAQGGYFVMTTQTYNGNLGGLSGANEKCLAELQGHPWKGKGSAGKLTAGRVKAFLCDNTTCNNLNPYTRYIFARTRDVAAGGTVFTADINGIAPPDSVAWQGASYFNISTSWWSNRNGGAQNWVNSPSAANTACSNWSLTTGNGVYGATSYSGVERWKVNATGTGCSGDRPLICMVNSAVEE